MDKNINEWKITLFTTQEIFNNVKDELTKLNYNVVIEDRNRLLFHYKIKEIVKNQKIKKLIFLTICNYMVHLFITFRSVNLGITIHNANSWFNKTTIRKVSHYLKRFIIFKLKRNSSFFILNSENMKNFVYKNNNDIKSLYVLPFSLRKHISQENMKNLLLFILGG